MDLRSLILDETGTITVDWAVLTTAVTGMALASASLLTLSLDSFSGYNERELLIANEGGTSTVVRQVGGYDAADSAMFALYVSAMAELSLDDLDALAGYANRLQAQGIFDLTLAVDGPADDGDRGHGNDPTFYDPDNPGIGIGGPNGNNAWAGTDVAALQDFVAAVDQVYVNMGIARPTHTRVNHTQVSQAFGALGLNSGEVARLWTI